MTRNTPTFAAVFLVLLVAGCGQSGPLYLPGDPSEIRTTPPEPADGEDEDDQGAASDSG